MEWQCHTCSQEKDSIYFISFKIVRYVQPTMLEQYHASFWSEDKAHGIGRPSLYNFFLN